MLRNAIGEREDHGCSVAERIAQVRGERSQRQFARDLDTMPGSLPLSGCVMPLHADSGDPDPLATAHGTADWSGLDVARSINAVAAASKERMPDNYLLLKANPGDVDWTNDEGWSTIVDHYRIAARLARQAGLRGLLLDFEPYTEPHRQFQYSRQPAAIDHSFADYQSAARRRGRQVMDAIATEFPNAELCTFFLLSYLIDDPLHCQLNVCILWQWPFQDGFPIFPDRIVVDLYHKSICI